MAKRNENEDSDSSFDLNKADDDSNSSNWSAKDSIDQEIKEMRRIDKGKERLMKREKEN